MNLKEIKELVDLITEKGITEFEMERSGVKLRIKRGGVEPQAVAVPHIAFQAAAAAPITEPSVVQRAEVPAPAHAAVAPPPAPAEEAEDLHTVKSPIVGTFYESPAPGADPFVKIGDHVHAGKVLCIIEAMKLMNEIESDASGVIVKRFVENGQPVEYGEPLFAIRPDK